VSRGEEDVVRLMLHHGANANAVDTSGKTPLHLAVVLEPETVAVALVLLLLQHGAFMNAVDDEGSTPLERAARAESAFSGLVVRKLLDAGAIVNGLDARATAMLLESAVVGDGPRALEQLGAAGLVVESADSLEGPMHSMATWARPAATARALLALAPAARRAEIAHATWLRHRLAVLSSPGVLATFLAAGARCGEDPEALGDVSRSSIAYMVPLLKQLLRAGARRGMDEAVVVLVERVAGWSVAHARDDEFEKVAVAAARLLLAHGADPEPALAALRKRQGGRLPNALCVVLRESISGAAAAVGAAMLRVTGDRDATRLVLAFFSSLAPLGVRLGELAPTEQLVARTELWDRVDEHGRPLRPVVRARRRRRHAQQ
jgi:Ankyrin repeats (3 copies)